MAAAANGWPERGLNAVRRLLAGAAGAVRRQLANAITLARLVAVLPIWMLIEEARYETALVLFAVVENDPNLTDKKFPGNPTRSFRTRAPLRVTGEVNDWKGHAPEQLQAMEDGLARLAAQGVEAIED